MNTLRGKGKGKRKPKRCSQCGIPSGNVGEIAPGLCNVCALAKGQGAEGQDRESYSDTQDRESYTVTPQPQPSKPQRELPSDPSNLFDERGPVHLYRDPEADREWGNPERADAAGVALEAFAGECGQNMEAEPADVIADLLCNLAHYCDRNGWQLPKMAERARMHYLAETGDKGRQFDLYRVYGEEGRSKGRTREHKANRTADPQPIKVLVVIEGGCYSAFLSNSKKVEVDVFDWDNFRDDPIDTWGDIIGSGCWQEKLIMEQGDADMYKAIRDTLAERKRAIEREQEEGEPH